MFPKFDEAEPHDWESLSVESILSPVDVFVELLFPRKGMTHENLIVIALLRLGI